MDENLQGSDDALSVGMITRSHLRKLEHEGKNHKVGFMMESESFNYDCYESFLSVVNYSSHDQQIKFVHVSKCDEILPDDVCY